MSDVDLRGIYPLPHARLQAEKPRLNATQSRDPGWREVPVESYHHSTDFPSIYAPPPPFHGSRDSRGIGLVPQPTVSPEDPLNWSWWKKHAVLAALIPGCLLSDWTLTWGTTVFELQAPEW
jgi:hypothetical protein